MSSAGFRQVLHGEEVPRSIISTVVFPALVLGEKTITMRAAFECTRTNYLLLWSTSIVQCHFLYEK
jgi:hypothetical protein